MLPMAALLAACGSTQGTAYVRDDVYDIPDRTRVAAVPQAPATDGPVSSQDDYYDAGEARSEAAGSLGGRDYYDLAYNDPYWYNRGRFGWNMSVGYGMGMGMGGWGMNYGWPTGWGGMSVGFGSGWYDPYWGNSWTSGYGMWGRPWGWGGYGMYNPYWGGGWGGPYQGPWGGCFGCYEPVGYGSSVVYGHRPSWSGAPGTTDGGGVVNPRGYRNPAGLVDRQAGASGVNGRTSTFRDQVRPSGERRPMDYNSQGRRVPGVDRSGTVPTYDRSTRPAQRGNNGRITAPARQERAPSRNGSFGGGGDRGGSFGGGGSSPSRGGGGGGGGGGRTSPRPR